MAEQLPTPRLVRRGRAEQTERVAPFAEHGGAADEIAEKPVQPHHGARGLVAFRAQARAQHVHDRFAHGIRHFVEAQAVVFDIELGVLPSAPQVGVDGKAHRRALRWRHASEQSGHRRDHRRRRRVARLQRKQIRHDVAIGRDAGERRLRQLCPAAEQFLGARALSVALRCACAEWIRQCAIDQERGRTDESRGDSCGCRTEGTSCDEHFTTPDTRLVIALTIGGISYNVDELRFPYRRFRAGGRHHGQSTGATRLRVGVIETEFGIYDKPRALTFDHEVDAGLSGLRPGGPDRGVHRRLIRGTHYLGIDGRVIKKFEPMPPPYPLTWPPTSTFVQPEVERLLREGVAASATVDVFLGHHGVALHARRSRRGAHGSRT